MKNALTQLRQLRDKAMTVGRYLYGDAPRERQSSRMGVGTRSTGGGRGSSVFSAEPRDPLETSILGGDRDEYIDKSFWRDAEAHGTTFDESRVDGVWDEDGSESWK